MRLRAPPILVGCSSPQKLNLVGGTTIHGLDNVMTLHLSILRILFDELLLWFEAIVSDNSKISYPFRLQQH